jgi:citrate lyase gamma subunit
MKETCVGSLESSDILIKTNNTDQIDLINLIKDLDNKLIIDRIKVNLEQHKIDVGITVYYNGANDWVIKSRLEALAFLIRGE